MENYIKKLKNKITTLKSKIDRYVWDSDYDEGFNDGYEEAIEDILRIINEVKNDGKKN